jgi:glycosyltransferase involved in cell wall biosynthesis
MGQDSMHYPFYSVIVTTHNSEKTIKKTLQSVIDQTYKNYELIIVDDASKDETVHVIHTLLNNSSLNFTLHILQDNHGVSYTRNYGIDLAKGEYVSFLDSDDLWFPKKLEVEAYYLTKQHINWVCSNYEVINEEYERINKRIRKPGLYSYADIIKNGNPIGMLTVAISTKILKNNKFRKLHHEDFDLWIRLAKKGYSCFTINDILASYMKSSRSLSGNKLKSIVWTYRVFRNNKMSIFKSYWLIIRYFINVINRTKK